VAFVAFLGDFQKFTIFAVLEKFCCFTAAWVTPTIKKLEAVS
jgi:hypothetical protein